MGPFHHHLEAAAEAIRPFQRGAEVEAAIQEYPWHHLAEVAVGEPFRQAVGEEADQLFHPGEAAVGERSPLVEVEEGGSFLLAAEVGEEP